MQTEDNYEKIEDIQSSFSTLSSTFRAGKTKDVAWRKWQLKQLWWLVEDNEAALMDAIQQDLNRPKVETYITDFAGVRKDIIYHLDSIDTWAADEIIGDSFIARSLGVARIRKEPLGVVLIIGAWNFPLLLVLQPLIAAIAAGCCAIIKPSELTIACQTLLSDLIARYLDPSAVRLIRGGISETTNLLELPFNRIFFTGSPNVGKIVSKAAATHLIPVTLELGGQSPAIVGRTANIDQAAKSIAYAKFLNAGQICLTVNHVFVDPQVHDLFVYRLKFWNDQFLNGDPTITTSIINKSNWYRLSGLLDQTEGSIIYGGEGRSQSLQMKPAVVIDIDTRDILLKDEIFGPICPVIKADVSSAYKEINEKPHPLAIYIFSHDKNEIQTVIDNTNSGGITINDVILHAGFPGAPFGGVGGSGHGYYHGPYGFKEFSHLRTIVNTPNWFQNLLKFRYPPYSSQQMAKIPQSKATFKREETLEDQRRRSPLISGARFALLVTLSGIFFYRWKLY